MFATGHKVTSFQRINTYLSSIMNEYKGISYSIFPVKSCGEVKFPRIADFLQMKKWDRNWMLIDDKNQFLTQREIPALNILKTKLADDGFHIYEPEKIHEGIKINFDSTESQTLISKIWASEVQVYLESKELSNWFSEKFDKSIRLVRAIQGERKKTIASKNIELDLAFEDGYPVHLINIRSFAELKDRIHDNLFIEQFRASIIYDGNKPYSEDLEEEFLVDGVHFRKVKACVRCIMINLPPESEHFSKEPLKTLSSYRNFGNSVHFGIYAFQV